MLIALGTAAARGQEEVGLAGLTVPRERQAPGCEMSPSPTVQLEGNRIRGGLWGGLPRNPWTASEGSIVADVRERVAASPRVPDGPPLTRTELARFRAELAEDVEQAYAAVYVTAGTSLITVNGVRFKRAPVPGPPRGMSLSGGAIRLVRGRTVVVASGEAGQCLDAIAACLTEIAAR